MRRVPRTSPSENFAHLFDPLVTTKPRGHGPGLGLAITSPIVDGFGARIAAVNREEGGAQFTIALVAANGRSIDSA
ncbi:hypothetical protein BG60_03080 [Caballeronia zhejiangensis]|uniref:histidine kinase n=1 Tax=Caballeronia zhejiangensis TaxID=871203 RepID=A0A656QUK0_9BURK|nr:integral membrane sensor signal transduction histidine kinase [Burkholderia sp. SJ98]KDR34273.1 hypothetical protein BG60_03080 [Caballeronia zhejiangensis]